MPAPEVGCAGYTLLGSAVGMTTALLMGVPTGEIGAGLWGFNSALTSLAVSVFFVHSVPSFALATGFRSPLSRAMTLLSILLPARSSNLCATCSR